MIPKLKKACDCNVAVFDIGCTNCAQDYRMATSCECTCKVMAPQLCPVFQYFDNCKCVGTTPAPGAKVVSAWLGWSDPTYSLADKALERTGSPIVYYYLFGFPTAVNCPISISGGIPIPWSLGVYEEVDLVASPVIRNESGQCIGGVVNISADNLALSDVVSDGDGVDCDQSGGFEQILLVALDSNKDSTNPLVICPFGGIVGKAGCNFTLSCCQWSMTDSSIPCDGEDGSAVIQRDYVLNGSCDCVPSLTVTIDGIVYTAVGSTLSIIHEVTPCTPGVTTVEIITDIVYPSDPMLCELQCPGGTTTEHVTV